MIRGFTLMLSKLTSPLELTPSESISDDMKDEDARDSASLLSSLNSGLIFWTFEMRLLLSILFSFSWAWLPMVFLSQKIRV